MFDINISPIRLYVKYFINYLYFEDIFFVNRYVSHVGKNLDKKG